MPWRAAADCFKAKSIASAVLCCIRDWLVRICLSIIEHLSCICVQWSVLVCACPEFQLEWMLQVQRCLSELLLL